MTTPTLVLKVNTIFDLTRFAKTQFPQHLPDYYLLLKGETSKMPSDIKFKINIQNQTSEFLGLYGQLVLNNVNGSSFPYFYMVLVASKKFNLSQKTSDYTPATNIIKEFKSQEDVDILIIRQYTTSTGGYHTNSNTMRQIISDGISVSENAVNNLLK